MTDIDVTLDARMIRHSGIGTYLQGLLGEYRQHPFFEKHRLGLALPPGASWPVDGRSFTFPFHAPVYSVREQLEYPLKLGRCRLWHAPHYNVPLLRKGTLLVVTIHDLIHWLFRKRFYSSFQAFYARVFLQTAVKSAARIITVSQRTREDLIQNFKVPSERIRVIYEGVEPEFFQDVDPREQGRLLEKYSLPERFFLYVGLIKPHKNVKRLLEVFKRLRAEGRVNSALVLLGKKDRNYPKGFEILQRLKTGEGIYYLPKVETRRELFSLYRSARALIHPSLYEGFGLTCLEAMASGTPVIVSRVASLPEVVGEAGLYVDPNSDASLADAIVELEENEKLRRQLAEKGRLRARQFTWAKAASETIRVYEEVLG